MGLLRTLLIILIIYLALKLIRNLVIAGLKRKVSQAQQGHQSQQQSKTDSRKEGEVKVEKVPDSYKKSKDVDGEYVDFEEVKE